MKTLKQIADELGVPKQQVYRYVRAECINEVHHDADEAHQSKSVKYYDEAAESTIKAYFQGKAQPIEVHHEAHHDTAEVHHEVHQNPDEVHHDAVREAVPESLNSIIEAMQAGHAAEIQRLDDAHRQEIQRLQAELDRLHADLTDTRTALEVERQHSRETADKLAQLTQNAQTLQLAAMQPQAIETAEQTPDTTEATPEKPPSFWKRLFGKK